MSGNSIGQNFVVTTFGESHGVAPTPFAERLSVHVDTALAAIRDGLEENRAFDPATAQRTFNIIMTDALCHHRLQVENYADLLDEIMLKRDDGIRIMPELYVVPKDKVLCNVQLW